MVQIPKHLTGSTAARILFAVAVCILALEPILWLVRTWRDPSYDSQGFLVFLVAAGLFAWSVTSERLDLDALRGRHAIWLLIATAAIRLAGQVLAINTIGAIALVIDVYAIALLCGLHARARAVAPGWLALCFAFSLPLERIVQRTIGYGLQNLSADGACVVLGTVFDDVICEGVRIVIAGVDVLVDLPCSGARAALLLLLLFCAASAVSRPGPGQALGGITVTLAAALVANIVRICILAAGIAKPELFFGIDVMEQPWHDLVGLVTLLIGGAPIIAWASLIHRVPRPARAAAAPSRQQRPRIAPRINPIIPAIAFLALAAVIVNLPHRPVDVVKRDITIDLPERLAGYRAQPIALSTSEESYFVQFGGAAAKAGYGPNNLLIVRTSAPLRHLHTPEDCLRGLGFDVDYLGVTYTPAPTAIYRARSQDGQAWLVHVSFVSDAGDITTNIAEAVWRWMQPPGGVWSAVQRITPVDIPEADRLAWDRAVFASLDLPTEPTPVQFAQSNGENHD
jgi:exosortase/archaeosortase family protein